MGAAKAQNSFPSLLSLRRQSYKLIWSKKKIIKKTYKITIEKVILLGEAPLRLRGAFVLFLNAFSLPPREYRLLAKTLAASWGSRPGGWGHGSRGGALGFRVRPGPRGQVWDGESSREPLMLPAGVAFSFWSLRTRGQRDPGYW